VDVDTVIAGGRVLSQDPSIAGATAVAVSGSRIAAVGDDASILAMATAGTGRIDARGGTIMPGIHDAHLHPISGGRQLGAATLDYERLDRDGFLERIAGLLARTAGEEPDGWLRVSLWDATSMSALPERRDLDGLSTGRPILVVASDAHIALANSRALKLAGIDRETPAPPSGEIRRDPGGEPTGILLDAAINLVAGLAPAPTPEQDADALGAGYAEMARAGITSCLHAEADETELRALSLLAGRGPLPVRTHAAVRIDAEDFGDPAEMLAHAEGLKEAYERPGIAIDNIKMFFDGVIEHPTQTAALLEPYLVDRGAAGEPRWVPGESRGPTYWPREAALPAIAAADAAGWQVHVHAIGDRATRDALDCFEAARARNGAGDNRHTIAHLELVDPGDLPRFAELGVLANMQMQWAERDPYTVDALQDHLGPERHRNVYPAGGLLAAGATLCGGSDWPVDPLLPFRQIEKAVTRTADGAYGGYPGMLHAEQRIPLDASIAMHTRNSAFQLHQEGETGRLAPGMEADLLLADRDLGSVPAAEIASARSRLTMKAGAVVHRDPDL
jgi:predicted amidohydrolase YtcJ